MEADAADIIFSDGNFMIAARTGRCRSSRSRRCRHPGLASRELGVELQGAGAFSADAAKFSQWLPHLRSRDRSGTGAVVLDRYTVVDDIGTVVNPLLATGQIQGGVAQGSGAGADRGRIYDRDSGQRCDRLADDYGIPAPTAWRRGGKAGSIGSPSR